MSKSFYITTAISYPNGPPHVGHAYEAIATDALARFKRLDGYDVMFLTGVDEHGLKMYHTARSQNLSPQDMADKLTPHFVEMTNYLNISNDDFIRTSQGRHAQAVKDIWQRLEKAGDIYKDVYTGWYSVRDEAFFAEEELHTNEKGQKVSPTGAPVEWTEEDSYFFRLSAYEKKLLSFYEAEPHFIAPPTRRNEIISFVAGGLRDLSISRSSFDWGIPVPGDEKHIIYVWVDALTNYLTGVGHPDIHSASWQRYWPADLHIIGKDIIRFHAVYWPAFLMSAGLPLPQRVFAHGFLTVAGEKMSKSQGNVMAPEALLKICGLDQLRYFFLRETPFGSDGNYSHDALYTRINADLANDLGNMAQRSLSMIARHYQGQIPTPKNLSEDDKALLEHANSLYERVREHMEVQAIHLALGTIFECVGAGNRYFAAQAPWTLNDDPQRRGTVLYVTAEVLRQIALLLQPIMPGSMAKLLDFLGVETGEGRQFTARKKPLRPQTSLPTPQPLFPRLTSEPPDARR